MIQLIFAMAGSVLLAQDAPPPVAVDEQRLAAYLTKDGELTSALVLRDEERSFGAFFGTIWRIEPDGQWTIYRVYRRQSLLIGKGKLEKKQLVHLAEQLSIYDPLTLVNVGRPLVNPHVVSVSYAGKSSVMVFGVDVKAPKIEQAPKAASPLTGVYITGSATKVPPGAKLPPVPTDPLTRFAGLQSVVRNLIQPNLGVDLDLPLRLKQLGQP